MTVHDTHVLGDTGDAGDAVGLTEVKPAAEAARASGANPLAEEVYRRLKSDIFNFRLFPGDRFSESDIAQHYGVSRTPMRDGLFRLQREGYLEVGFRRGWKVAPLNFARIDQLYELRIVLELAALERLVSGDARQAPIDALKRIWCVSADAQETDAAVMFENDEHFHRQIVASTGNDEMLRVHDDVTERIRIVRRLDFLKRHRTKATYDEHAKLLQLLEDKKLAQASDLLRAHITQSKREVRDITVSMLAEAREHKLPFVS